MYKFLVHLREWHKWVIYCFTEEVCNTCQVYVKVCKSAVITTDQVQSAVTVGQVQSVQAVRLTQEVTQVLERHTHTNVWLCKKTTTTTSVCICMSLCVYVH